MNKKIAITIICLFAFLGIFDFLHPGFPITHDGQDHIARIANFYTNLQQGVVIPRWAANLNWGYGHPILEFLYPFPSYLASFSHFIGFNFTDATKIVFIVAMFGSGLFMFLWLSTFLEIIPATVGALMYMFAPYRFVDLYVRGDIGEHVAFMFMPLVLFFIKKYFKTKNIAYGISISFSLGLLILSHNVISLIYIPLILFYCLYILWFTWKGEQSRKEKQRKGIFVCIVFLLIFLALGFSFSSFFWLPALFEGQYTLRSIVTAGEYLQRFVSFPALLYGPWNYGQTGQFTVQLGVVQWFMFFAGIISLGVLHNKKDKRFFFVIALIFYTLIALFLMLPISNFIWARSSFLQDFQFPWRFLAIPVFSTAVLGAIVTSLLPKKQWTMFLGVFIIAIILANISDFHAKGYITHPDSFYSGIYKGTTDTGESAPIWSVRFMEHGYSQPLEVISGNITYQQIKRTSIEHVYKVDALVPSRLLENTLFFPYWEVFIDGKKTNIEFQDFQRRGLITFLIDKGEHTVVVHYTDTRLRKISNLISIVSIIILSIVLFFSILAKRRYKIA